MRGRILRYLSTSSRYFSAERYYRRRIDESQINRRKCKSIHYRADVRVGRPRTGTADGILIDWDGAE